DAHDARAEVEALLLRLPAEPGQALIDCLAKRGRVAIIKQQWWIGGADRLEGCGWFEIRAVAGDHRADRGERHDTDARSDAPKHGTDPETRHTSSYRGHPDHAISGSRNTDREDGATPRQPFAPLAARSIRSFAPAWIHGKKLAMKHRTPRRA